MQEDHVFIIGAGVSGLAAARRLAGHRRRVTVLEARERIGGRVHTIRSQTGDFPVELGAEFVHGAENETWELLRAAHLPTEEVPDRHWIPRGGEVHEQADFWDMLSRVTGRINLATPDQDFQSFIDQAWSLDDAAKNLAKEYVESFHAAETERISVHALANAEVASQREQGTRQFRLTGGYRKLLEWLWNDVTAQHVDFHFGTVAKEVRWEPGLVEIVARSKAGLSRMQGRCVLCTVPVSLLQPQAGEGFLSFHPELQKETAISDLAMGQVCKIVIQFKERFWRTANFGFIHAKGLLFPTWWSSPYGPVLTGWAGGPRARNLNGQLREEIRAAAIASLARLFHMEAATIDSLVAADYFHNWQTDPFSAGAYSYTPARMMQMSAALAEPIADTLFFAGEATDVEGGQGTIQGALRSGYRGADQIRQALRRKFAHPSLPQAA